MTDTTTPLPPVVDRDTWTAQVNELRVRETATPARATRSPPPAPAADGRGRRLDSSSLFANRSSSSGNRCE